MNKQPQMNQQPQMNNTPMSIYIPRMANSTTESQVMEIFHIYKIGDVRRVDFTPLNKKPGFAENNTHMKSGFVHFNKYYNTYSANRLIEKIQNGDTFNLSLNNINLNTYIGEYWILLKAKTTIPDTMMNNHQIVENCRFLEKKIEEQENTIKNLTNDLENVRNVVYQLVGGLFCHKTQNKILNAHNNILFNDDVKEKDFTDNSKWGAYPTTRQGDENLERITNLEKFVSRCFLEGKRMEEEQDDNTSTYSTSSNYSDMPSLISAELSDVSDSEQRIKNSYELCGNE
jgi:hypothetical protein